MDGNVAPSVDFDKFGDYNGSRVAAVKDAKPLPLYRFQGRVSADGSTGFLAEPQRYHLYVSWSCPWAQRSAIVRKLKGLDNVVSLSAVDPIRDGRGWAFRKGEHHGPDPLNGFRFLKEAFEKSEAGYDGLVSVPVLWDRQTEQIVSNNFPDITLDLNQAFDEWAMYDIDLYPVALRGEIDSLNAWILRNINSAVYAVGNVETQTELETAVHVVFGSLDEIEKRLSTNRYLHGDALTESDVRLWVTLARLDVVHHGLYRTNLRKLTDYPNLWSYARELYQIPAFHETTYFDDIKRHYYMTQTHLNPDRLVPPGPVIDWDVPHGR